MNITCPKCNFSKSVDPAKVPDRPIKVNCPKCAESFSFEKPVEHGRKTVEPKPEQITCPACGLVQAKDANCNGCGVNYAKYNARQKENPQAGAATDLTDGNLSELRNVAINHSPEFQPKAGFWVRVVATILESFLLLIVQFVLTLMITMVIGLLGVAAADDPAVSVIIWLFGTTISLGYAVFFTGYCGQTPGKMALRIKVVRTDGSQLTYGRAAKREVLGKFVSSLLLGIGYLMVAFDNQKQGLHDKIADTYVVKL
jgi:predicted Zn finger-like uncharacterized protein